MFTESDNESRSRTDTPNPDLMRKLPPDAEATAVLVGAVDFLQQPTVAFVRLAKGVNMENIVEVHLSIY